MYVETLFCSGVSRSVCDENELSPRGRILSSGSLEDLFLSDCVGQLPLVYRIDDWHLYDNSESFDDDDETAGHLSVTLISYVQYDWTDDDNFAAFASTAQLDSPDSSEVDDSPSTTSEQGFYDVTMLSGAVYSEAQLSSCLNDADKEGILIHPELQLEYIMATHHRQRRVAEQLLASDGLSQTSAAAAAAVDADEDVKHCKLSREPSFVTVCPQPSKVKPDNFWIRDVADTLPSDSEEEKCVFQSCSCESAGVCSCGSSLPVDSKPQQSSAGNSVPSSPISPCSPARKVIDIAQQLAQEQEECSVDKLTETSAKLARPLSIYETEGIDFEPGLVRRTVDLGVDVSASPVKTAASHPVSIYETEEISLEPGLVRRTRQEIEQRERYLCITPWELFCVAHLSLLIAVMLLVM